MAASEGGCLFRLVRLAALGLFDRLFEVRVEIATKLRQVGAAGREDPLAVRVVRERVQKMF
jgi:hypothetical protein